MKSVLTCKCCAASPASPTVAAANPIKPPCSTPASQSRFYISGSTFVEAASGQSSTPRVYLSVIGLGRQRKIVDEQVYEGRDSLIIPSLP